MSGIRTPEDLRQRCYIDPESGCWRWRGGFSAGQPSVWIVLPDETRSRLNGRRAALTLAGLAPKPGHVASAKLQPACQHRDCVNPDHCRSGRKAAIYASQARDGRFKTPQKIAAARRVAATINRQLTPIQVREVLRADPSVSCRTLGERIGCSGETVRCIRAGTTWRDVSRAPASVFDLGSL